MPLMVVRHAHAMSRSDWEGDDNERELTSKGRKQARLLVPELIEMKPRRILSSPSVRCLATVGPLAEATGVTVEADRRLAEGAGRRAVDLARSLTDATAVLCSHGDVIPEILAAVAEEDGVDLGAAPRVEKASVWILEGGQDRFVSARYLPPPKRG